MEYFLWWFSLHSMNFKCRRFLTITRSRSFTRKQIYRTKLAKPFDDMNDFREMAWTNYAREIWEILWYIAEFMAKIRHRIHQEGGVRVSTILLTPMYHNMRWLLKHQCRIICWVRSCRTGKLWNHIRVVEMRHEQNSQTLPSSRGHVKNAALPLVASSLAWPLLSASSC